jgi:Protein of unknown function (DUF2924)
VKKDSKTGVEAMDNALRNEIEALRRLTTKGLQDRYRKLFGEASPSSNRDHLFRRIAWRLQARAEGGLSDRARKRARLLADDCDIRLRAPRQFWEELEAKGAARTRDLRLPAVGSVLKRSYRGQEIIVTVQEDGFEYCGRRYAALSSIACEVTGTRWNGFAFFGLNEESHGG